MRLIDADKLLNDNRELADCDFVHPLYEDTLRDIIDDAPTVEVCEDCISREEAIRVAEQGQIQGYEWQFKQLCNLPSVTPCTSTATLQDLFDKIIAEIDDEVEYAYADFDRYKEDILYAEADELPDDDFRYGLRRAIEIINKYKAES